MKQKFLLLAMALLGCMNVAKAEDAPEGLVTIPDGVIQQGGYGYVSVFVNNLPEKSYNGFGVKFKTPPEGITFVDIQILDDETGYEEPTATTGDNTAIIFSLHGAEEGEGEGGEQGGGEEQTGEKETAMFRAGSYQLCKLVFKAASTVALGDVEIQISEMSLSGADGKDYAIHIPSFKLNVTTDLRVLDESSPNSPMNTPGTNKENVKVKRTIKAGTWSTLCLPFDLPSTQKNKIFGNDAEIAILDEIVSNEENENDIHLKFGTIRSAAKLSANTPYLIRTSSDIDEFTVNNVTVNGDHPKTTHEYYYDPDNDEDYLTLDFVGVFYKQNIPENGIFLNGNSFYYSTGKSTIKGYRGYFVLDDGLQKIVFEGSSPNSSLSNISISIDDELTAIEGISNNYRTNDDVYSVNGVYMGKASDMKKYSRGVYIVNGKKVVIK